MGLVGTIGGPDRASLGENSRMMVSGTHQQLDGVWIRFVQGIADASAVEGDVTDNMSGGYTEPTRGPRTCRISADCIFRAGDNPLKFPPKFLEGEFCGRVILWPDYDNDPNVYFKLPVGMCVGFTLTASGVADVRFSLALRSVGVYYTPSRPDPAGVAS
jgi:hypothetical protein